MKGEAVVVAVCLAIGVFLLLAGPALVELWFMDQRLEIIRMGIEAQKAESRP